MASNIIKLKNGICGYAPQGSTGDSGADGYHIYYSPFNSNTDGIQNMLKAIENEEVFSNNPDYKSSKNVDYKEGDMIITADSNILVYSKQPLTGKKELKNVGKIKLIENAYEGDPKFKDIREISMKIIYNKVQTRNVYNYIDGVQSPLYHHRDTHDWTTYGMLIQIMEGSDSYTDIKTIINNSNGEFCKLVLNFNSGLRFEKIININNCYDYIFIDNRYFYPFGHPGDYWPSDSSTIISSYAQERGIDLTENLKTYGSKSLCNGYIEFFFKNKEYRKKIKLYTEINNE